jgi:hypothetical protein
MVDDWDYMVGKTNGKNKSDINGRWSKLINATKKLEIFGLY